MTIGAKSPTLSATCLSNAAPRSVARFFQTFTATSQAAAAGKGISELIRKGRYETIDLSPLGVERIFTNRKVLEEGSLVH